MLDDVQAKNDFISLKLWRLEKKKTNLTFPLSSQAVQPATASIRRRVARRLE